METERSMYGFSGDVKLKGRVIGFVQRQWECECAVNGCWAHGSVLSVESSKGRASETVRRHYAEVHSGGESIGDDGTR